MARDGSSKRAPRGVLSRLLKGYASAEFLRYTVHPADAYVDSALSQFEDEEPSALRWFEGDEVRLLLRAHTASLHAVLAEADKHRTPVDKLIKSLDALTYRLLVAVAVGAIRQEREIHPFELPGGSE